jgi:hypothetical protein
VEEVLQVIRNRLSTDPSFPESSPSEVDDVKELLDVCLTATYCQFEDKFCQQKEVISMGNSLSPVVSSILMEHSGEISLDAADYNPLKGSYTSTTHSWYDHMDQQSCSNFFTISTALGLPAILLWKWRLMIFLHSWTF